jgi:hypothetical protein
MFIDEKAFGEALLKPIEYKHDVLSIEGVKEWLETKDPAEEYNYLDAPSCLFSQYLMARGVGGKVPYATKVWHQLHDLYRGVGGNGAYTFGAALERAKAGDFEYAGTDRGSYTD